MLTAISQALKDDLVQAILVRPNWRRIDQSISQQRRRTLWVFSLGMLVIVILVGVAQRTVGRLVFQAILVDAGTWGTAWGIAIWYALRYRPEGRRVAVLHGGFVALVFSIANVLPKWSVDSWIPKDMQGSPILFWGVWHVLALLSVRWLLQRYPREMRAMGLSLGDWRRNIGFGVLGGGVLAGHFLFALAFTGGRDLSLPAGPDFAWQLFFEIASSLTTESFFRGAVYRYLERERQWGYWRAALVSALLNVSVYLVKVKWSGDVLTAVGVLFYIFMISMINARLYRWTRSLMPGYISALIFNLTATLES